MLPALLITFREVIEASLIVATILGILKKLKQSQNIKTVWLATLSATLVSVMLLGLGSLLGLKVQQLYTGKVEQLFEGMMMVVSAVFITWAVFWLHTYFAKQKLAFLQKVKHTLVAENPKALFILVFTAVFREGFEIVLFLSTIYLTTNPMGVFMGFGFGLVLAFIVAGFLFTATLKLPVFYAFQTTTILLILFAAGLLARGVAEFIELGWLPQLFSVTLNFIPASGQVGSDLVKSLFGLSQSMNSLQLVLYGFYIAFMRWYVYQRKTHSPVKTS